MVLKPYLEIIERDECKVSLLPANKKFGAEEEAEPVQVSTPGNNETLVPIL